MHPLDRRTFLHISAGALFATTSGRLLAVTEKPSISTGDGTVRVKGTNYFWEYSQSNDTFRLLDSKNRLIVTGTLQPALVVAPAREPKLRQSTPGKLSEYKQQSSGVTFVYDGVNGNARLTVRWRFDEYDIWTEPVLYETTKEEDVVSLHYFTDVSSTNRPASLHSSYLVVPGISEGPSISPIVRDDVHLNENVWIGRGSLSPGLPGQQWGLPVHYFCGFSIDTSHGGRNLYTSGKSEAFACGLADLPLGDLYLNLQAGKSSLWIDYRSDLWNHLRGPGRLSLGATLFWAVAPDYYGAIASYYQGLLQAGIIQKHHNSAKKTAVALTPQYCTWGAQADRDKTGERLDELSLNQIYADLKASGMDAGLFSIDDKWEGTYGNLEHSAARFPHFEQFLDRLRADGFKIGLWAALMRCERPADLGLTEDQMLQQPDGKPYLVNFSGSAYYILDFTQPLVAKVLGDIAKKFIRRYNPDLLKFDFGYELPPVSGAAPRDKNWTGERLMWKGLDVVIKAMREENPDLVVMYYNLSPLFLDYFDLHSPDDMYLAAGEYDMEANRRFFFSSLLGQLGVPTYGSSGYDWSSTGDIWFDSAVVGTLGSLNDFKADERGQGGSPEMIARYNGLARVLRSTNAFEILPLDVDSESPTRGAHARSWARFEGGELVLLAFRPPLNGGQSPLTQTTDTRLKDAVNASMPIVVSSHGSHGITRSGKLAVVAYGKGEITLRRQKGSKARIASHYFGGTIVMSQSQVEAGQLKVTAVQHDTAGMPLEWMEIEIT